MAAMRVPGAPDLVLRIREGFLEEVMAKLKPEGKNGFILVRVGKGVLGRLSS